MEHNVYKGEEYYKIIKIERLANNARVAASLKIVAMIFILIASFCLFVGKLVSYDSALADVYFSVNFLVRDINDALRQILNNGNFKEIHSIHIPRSIFFDFLIAWGVFFSIGFIIMFASLVVHCVVIAGYKKSSHKKRLNTSLLVSGFFLQILGIVGLFAVEAQMRNLLDDISDNVKICV